MATAVSAGTVSELTGGKFANGTISGAFIHMFNSLASTIAGQVTKKGANDLNINKSMSNILKSGATGMVAGAVIGFGTGPDGIAVRVTFGFALGLTKGGHYGGNRFKYNHRRSNDRSVRLL